MTGSTVAPASDQGPHDIAKGDGPARRHVDDEVVRLGASAVARDLDETPVRGDDVADVAQVASNVEVADREGRVAGPAAARMRAANAGTA